MPAPDSIIKFFNPEMPPAPGGWHYWLDPKERKFPINGGNSDLVFRALRQYQQNNRLYVSDAAVWEELWKYWCSLEPARCRKGARPVVASELPGKEVWGPILWRFLNWAAVNYRAKFFAALVEEMRTRLIGCPECRAHFEQILIRRPASVAKDAASACRWVNDVHNEVNASLGKPHYPYVQMVEEYGAPT